MARSGARERSSARADLALDATALPNPREEIASARADLALDATALPNPREEIASARADLALDATRASDGDRRPGALDETIASDVRETRARAPGDDTRDGDDDLGSSARARQRLPAERIGRYVVLRKLGEGGMGEVYAAYDEELDRRVAIKVVHERLSGTTMGRARMQREAQAMARLSHPNVVQVHDVGAFAGQVFVAMEFVKGETLGAWQARQDASTETGRRALLAMYAQAGRGLAAAHEQGLVHRDFKPDNVLVGDDERARVLDFGLAATQREASVPERGRTAAHAALSGGILDSDLTRTGSVMGTPAYMAPEQFLAAPTDARTDQFCFCAALYEALYGELPFAGDTFVARELEVTEGSVRPASAPCRIPGWLRTVVVRGLARRPEERYSSMDALLEALARDPAQQRRRWLRVAAAVVAVVVVTVGLVFAYGVVSEHWREQARQGEALARLAAIDARIDTLLAAGDVDAAERAFAYFVDAPENRGTNALSRAWLHRAERERALLASITAAPKDIQGIVNAFAAAYTVARADEERTAALLGLAGFLRRQLRMEDARRALATIDADAEIRAAPEVAALERDLRVASRDLEGALAAVEHDAPEAALLRALGQATATGHHGIESVLREVVDSDGDGVGELVFNRGRRGVEFVGAAPSLPEIGAAPLTTKELLPIPLNGEASLFVGHREEDIDGERRSTGAVMRRDGDRFVDVFTWPEHVVTDTLVVDVDGDGDDEIFVGTGPYTRRLVELRRGEGDAWSMGSPAPEVDARRSDVQRLVAADLDGDGRVEVIASLGPWSAYELQVLHHEPTAGLELVCRRKLGMTSNVELLRRGDELLLAALKNSSYPNPEVFPVDAPHGASDGLHVLRFTGATLESVDHVPDPAFLGDGVNFSRRALFTGDLDGDGDDEIIIMAQLKDERRGVIQRFTEIYAGAPGSRAPLSLGYTNPLGVFDLDGDGDDELIVEFEDIAEGKVWVLGAGQDRLPQVAAAPPPRAATGGPEDPSLAAMWRQVHELAAIGLPRQAAAGLARLADLSDDASRGDALLAAAALYEEGSDDDMAAQIYGRAMRSPEVRGAAARGAAHNAVRHGDYAGAVALADAGLTEVGLAPELRAALIATRGRLAGLADGSAATRFDFDVALPGAWAIHDPLALRRDTVTQTLRIDAAEHGVLATLPLRRVADHLALELDLELVRGEFASRLTFVVVPAGGELRDALLRLQVETGGGAGELAHTLMTTIGGPPFGVGRIPAETLRERGSQRYVVRVAVDHALAEGHTLARSVDGDVLFYARQTLDEETLAELRDADDELDLLITMDGPNTQAIVDIHHLRITGAVTRGQASTATDARARAARALVEGRPRVTLAILDGLTSAGGSKEDGGGNDDALRWWRLAALLDLERWSEAQAELAAALSDDGTALPGPVAALIHARPELVGGLLRDAVGELRRTELIHAVWWVPFQSGGADPRALRILYDNLTAIEALGAPASDLLVYLEARAAVHSRLGLHDRACDDYDAALALVDSGAVTPTETTGASDSVVRSRRASRRRGLELNLAIELARSGELARAQAILAPRLAQDAVDGTRLALIDRLRAQPELAPLVDEWLAQAH